MVRLVVAHRASTSVCANPPITGVRLSPEPAIYPGKFVVMVPQLLGLQLALRYRCRVESRIRRPPVLYLDDGGCERLSKIKTKDM